MRKIKEVLRLKFEAKLSHERIAAATGVSKGTVTNFVQRAVHKGLGWPLPEDLDEAGLEALLFRQAAACEQYERPEFAAIHQELKRKGVTLQLLWEEYRVPHGRAGLRLQPVLRALPGLSRQPWALDAPGASSRREAVHRLQR
jgi:hypothetical protein